MQPQMYHFKYLPLSQRVTFTMTLLVLGVGYLFAMIQVFTVHAGRDGNPSLSAADLRIAYSGKPGGTRLESALNGPMQGMLPPEVRQVILKWAHEGGAKGGYDTTVKSIMDNRCVACHNGSNPHQPNLNNYDDVGKLVTRDEGVDIGTLVRISHIHLFGMTFIFFIVSLIFVHAYVRRAWVKCAVIATPFLAVLADIFSWYLTKLYPGFAWVVMGGGVLMGLSFAYQWAVSMWQMWPYRVPQELLDRGGALPSARESLIGNT